jgi:hypothetical protein
MKSLIITLVVLCTIIFGGVSFKSTAATNSQKHKAVAKFDSPVMLQGVVLKGEYLFVHDDAAMSRGEACTFVYRGQAEVAKRLVASFHCTPVQRAKARHFIVRSVESSLSIVEVREYQFEGETEGHAVPTVETVR